MAFHDIYEANESGQDYVVGDIHGMYSELIAAMNEWGFDKSKDRLFSVGDLTDRGPDNEKVLGLIFEPWFFPVMGNHEEMMLMALSGVNLSHWVANGGGWAFKNEEELPALYEICNTVKDLPYAITINHKSGSNFGVCHAQTPVRDWADIESVEDNDNARQGMVWGRTAIKETGSDAIITKNISLTIHGHTPVESPVKVGNALFIDTGCFFTGKIEIVSLDDLSKSLN